MHQWRIASRLTVMPRSARRSSMSVPHTAVAQVEAKGQPNCVGNDVGREAMSFISIHWPSLALSLSLLG